MRPAFVISMIFALIPSLVFSAASTGKNSTQWKKIVVDSSATPPVTAALYYPKDNKEENRRVLILLHSYGKSSAEWEKVSGVSKLADEYGVILVCPDMGKTVYENEYYDETTVKWNSRPGGVWMSQVLIPYLQKNLGLCKEKKYTGIAGLEIGARGALLTAARNPDVFGFVGGISGMYDSASLTRSDIFTCAYGKIKENKDRWDNADSIIQLAPSLSQTAIFLSHGKKERNPGIDQSQLVLIRLSQLKKKQGGFAYRFFEKGYGDSWSIWSPSLVECFKDFDAFVVSQKDK